MFGIIIYTVYILPHGVVINNIPNLYILIYNTNAFQFSKVIIGFIEVYNNV